VPCHFVNQTRQDADKDVGRQKGEPQDAGDAGWRHAFFDGNFLNRKIQALARTAGRRQAIAVHSLTVEIEQERSQWKAEQIGPSMPKRRQMQTSDTCAVRRKWGRQRTGSSSTGRADSGHQG
jgi:hypothetical protein